MQNISMWVSKHFKQCLFNKRVEQLNGEQVGQVRANKFMESCCARVYFTKISYAFFEINKHV